MSVCACTTQIYGLTLGSDATKEVAIIVSNYAFRKDPRLDSWRFRLVMRAILNPTFLAISAASSAAKVWAPSATLDWCAWLKDDISTSRDWASLEEFGVEEPVGVNSEENNSYSIFNYIWMQKYISVHHTDYPYILQHLWQITGNLAEGSQAFISCRKKKQELLYNVVQNDT